MSLELHLIQPLLKVVRVNVLIFLGKDLDPDFSKLISQSRPACGVLPNGTARAGILQEPRAGGNFLDPTREKTFGRLSRVG